MHEDIGEIIIGIWDDAFVTIKGIQVTQFNFSDDAFGFLVIYFQFLFGDDICFKTFWVMVYIDTLPGPQIHVEYIWYFLLWLFLVLNTCTYFYFV